MKFIFLFVELILINFPTYLVLQTHDVSNHIIDFIIFQM